VRAPAHRDRLFRGIVITHFGGLITDFGIVVTRG